MKNMGRRRIRWHRWIVVGVALIACVVPSRSAKCSEIWERHTVDDTSRGADGVRLGDVNGDGRLDITTGWEEGGVTRLYVNPGRDKVKHPWRAITLGETKSAEDATFADLDGDGRLDVVTCCEGNRRAVLVHWNNSKVGAFEKQAWRQAEVPACRTVSRWMYAFADDLDGDGQEEVVLGSKNPNGQVSILSLSADANPRDLSQWKLTKICSAGWIMSLEPVDIDGDGDQDILVSDRRGAGSGIFWLENQKGGDWSRHPIAFAGEQNVMFLSVKRDTNKRITIVGTVKPNTVSAITKSDAASGWSVTRRWSYPLDRFGTVKSASILSDGVLIVSCESANGQKSGLFAITPENKAIDIAGKNGTKYDRVELIDLDEDGDQDILTCEESVGLGVIWFENPGSALQRSDGPSTK